MQDPFELALEHHQAGRLPEAERLYRQILAEDPGHMDAMHLLGVIAFQAGQYDAAVDLIGKVVALDPEYAEAHYNFGNALTGKGRFDDAIAAYRRAIALQPDYAEAYSNLGNALKGTGRLDEAIIAYRQAVTLNPNLASTHYHLGVALRSGGQLDDAVAAFRQAAAINANIPEVYNGLGGALKQKGEFEEAIAAYQMAIALRTNFAEAHSNLGNALADKGEMEAAVAAYRQAIALRPDMPETYSNLGSALKEIGQLDEAIAAYRKAISLRPNLSEAHGNLGIALRDRGDLDGAIAAYRQAIVLRPNFADIQNNLGIALQERGDLDEAVVAFERAIALKPDYAEAYSNLGSARKDRGEIEESIAASRQAIALRPSFAEAHSNLIYSLHYDPRCSQAELLAEHRAWAERHADPLKTSIRPHENDRDANRRLRVGYVSPDFHGHPVGRFILPLLAQHDHARFEIYCYASVQFPDAVTARIRRHADVWRDILTLSNEEAAELIRGDRIDILIDLSMHTAKNRMLLFARKPAPVQATYLAYPGTTGMEAMDYRITDSYLDPPGLSESQYTERPIYLADTYWCYAAPTDSAEVSPLPATSKGFVTFGSLNNFCKNSRDAIDAWGRILAAVPNSRLLLHAGVGSHRDAVRRRLRDAGIDPDRLSFANRVPLSQYMRQYDEIDIGLDPFPYVGGTTTCDALWMGVPVITLGGKAAISRGGASILSNVGLPELIAKSPDEYVRLAADLAGDLPRLTYLRSNLREKMRVSPLMDAVRFARSMEEAYRRMWTDYVSAR
ncbi:MAG TPA: tetratricopeptide repeat protein [Tepidisphaeraceae bacterium]|jgi:predicted O-linked N-acetylglucosamine transferase (SPINDLY family)